MATIASIPSSDITLLTIVVLSCTVVVLGALLCKRFFKRLFRTKAPPFQTSSSTSILPSFGAFKISPYDSLGRSAATDMHDSHLNLLPDTPYCLTPPSVCCSLDSPQTPSTDTRSPFSAMTSPTPATPRVDPVITNTDILPPNITIPIPRQTPLDRMIDRWRREAENDGTRGLQGARNSVYPPISYAFEEVNNTPSIIVTLPSSQAVSPTKAYASPGPDDDPFFWDTLPRLHENHVARDAPTWPTTPRQPKDSGAVNGSPIGLGLTFSPSKNNMTRVFEHLAVPSSSGKHKSRNRRTPLGDSTNSPSEAKYTTTS